jgi:DNA-binding transcriptional LysR family regulator
VRRLEQQLGVTLLERTSRRVELTPAGQALLKEGRRLLLQTRRAIQITRAAQTGQLVVGFYGSAAISLLPDVLKAFAVRQPAVDVSVQELLFSEVDDVLGGTIDLAFTRLLPEQTQSEVEILSREPRVVALPRQHALANHAATTFADLREESFVINPMVESEGPPARWLAEQRRHGLPGRIAAEAASIQEILTLVASGRGICLVPAVVARHYPREDIRYVEVSDADPAVVSLVWRTGDQRASVEEFIAAAKLIVAARAEPAATAGA